MSFLDTYTEAKNKFDHYLEDLCLDLDQNVIAIFDYEDCEGAVKELIEDGCLETGDKLTPFYISIFEYIDLVDQFGENVCKKQIKWISDHFESISNQPINLIPFLKRYLIENSKKNPELGDGSNWDLLKTLPPTFRSNLGKELGLVFENKLSNGGYILHGAVGGLAIVCCSKKFVFHGEKSLYRDQNITTLFIGKDSFDDLVKKYGIELIKAIINRLGFESLNYKKSKQIYLDNWISKNKKIVNYLKEEIETIKKVESFIKIKNDLTSNFHEAKNNKISEEQKSNSSENFLVIGSIAALGLGLLSTIGKKSKNSSLPESKKNKISRKNLSSKNIQENLK